MSAPCLANTGFLLSFFFFSSETVTLADGGWSAFVITRVPSPCDNQSALPLFLPTGIRIRVTGFVLNYYLFHGRYCYFKLTFGSSLLFSILPCQFLLLFVPNITYLYHFSAVMFMYTSLFSPLYLAILQIIRKKTCRESNRCGSNFNQTSNPFGTLTPPSFPE